MPEVSAVGGTDGKLLAPEIVLRLILARREGRAAEKVNFVRPLSGAGFEKMCVKAAPRTRAYIKIEDGCDSKCSYCAIKDARGPIRSKPPCEVVAEAEELYRSGCREIVLVGIETAAYGKDLGGGVSLADLILRLDSLGFPERIRLGSLAPELIGEEFVEKIKGVSRLAPHFHLSVQSGSDRVLRGMKRRYTSERALENIRRIRGAIKNAQFTTDMMVGFPGETEEDFICSEKFVREAGFLDVHVFAYSRRAGTDAAEYSDQVPESVKKARSRRLIEVKNEVRESCLARAVASSEPLFVIAETDLGGGVFSSHSDEFFEVHFNAGELEISQGDRLKVAPVSHKNGILYADVLEKM